MTRAVIAIVAGLLLAPPVASAQEPGANGERPIVALAAAGLLGGAVGAVGGGYLGALMASDQDEDLDEVAAALAGAAVGEALLLPLGVHLADGRRGGYWSAALVSAGLAGAGVAAMAASGWNPPVVPIVLVVVPVAQVGLSIAIERG